MTELASFQNEIVSSSNVPVQLSSGEIFPAYFNFECGLVKKVNKLLYGASLSYGSTGARTGYADFSGYYFIDQEIEYLSVLASFGYSREIVDDKLLIELDARPSIVFTMLNIIERLGVGSTNTSNNIEFRSFNVALQPSVSLTRSFSKFGVQAAIGYNFSVVRGKLYLKEDSEAFLLNDQGDKVRADWSGLRASIGFCVFF
ncbi:MAG: hypothetical protein ACK51D_13985 [Cyclobacteriaceae bacterium]|jgi:hypothetical protein